MTKLYILSTYEEHGAENMVATTDPEKLTGFLMNWDWGNGVWVDKYRTESVDKLKEVLKNLDGRNDAYNLNSGWGGTQLHVIEIIK